MARTHESSSDELDKTTIVDLSHILGHHDKGCISTSESSPIFLLNRRIDEELE